MNLEESLELGGIDFPLDDDEVRHLIGLYDVREPFGTLTMTTTNSIDWEASFSSE